MLFRCRSNLWTSNHMLIVVFYICRCPLLLNPWVTLGDFMIQTRAPVLHTTSFAITREKIPTQALGALSVYMNMRRKYCLRNVQTLW